MRERAQLQSRPSRRTVLASALAVPALLLARPGRAEAVLGEDGLYHESWFLQSFLDLRDDLQTAASAGKRLAIMWELRGCPYCRETHLVNLADKTIATYIRANFEVLQLDLLGLRQVTDFDGQVLAEKELAQKYSIRFTPTFQFFPPTAAGLEQKAPMAREVARAPGYLKPEHFLAMFRFVRDKGYETGSFRDYIAHSSG
jgi:thioredoxin-related protein